MENSFKLTKVPTKAGFVRDRYLFMGHLLANLCGDFCAFKEGYMKVGDRVYTVKGCRIVGCRDILVIIEIGRKWGRFDAVVCVKPSGIKRLFLTKNLRLYKVINGESSN